MKVYKCKRDEENALEGAVLVYAKNEDDARRYAAQLDAWYSTENEYTVSGIELKEGVVYNDYSR